MKRITLQEAVARQPEAHDTLDCYRTFWWHEEHGLCGAHRLLYHWTLHIGIHDLGYADRYCFQTQAQVEEAGDLWTDEPDPPGQWHKHPISGRRRNPVTGLIWHESEARHADGEPVL
jgi:hypothetical protein